MTPLASSPRLVPEETAPRAASPAPIYQAQPELVAGKMVNGVAVAAPGYIPKAGKLTVEDIEAELALLMERMEFLNNALEEIKKEA